MYLEIYGLKRNFNLPRLAANFAFRRTFCEGVSKARKRRTSSMIPSASSLFFSLFSALSIGSPFLTMTSGIKFSSDGCFFVRGLNSSRGFSERQSIKRKSLGERSIVGGVCFSIDFRAGARRNLLVERNLRFPLRTASVLPLIS